MAAKATSSTSFTLLAASLGSNNKSSEGRSLDFIADIGSDIVNAGTEVAGRAFSGAGIVWDASRKAGRLDGAIYAEEMLTRITTRAGISKAEAAKILAAL